MPASVALMPVSREMTLRDLPRRSNECWRSAAAKVLLGYGKDYGFEHIDLGR